MKSGGLPVPGPDRIGVVRYNALRVALGALFVSVALTYTVAEPWAKAVSAALTVVFFVGFSYAKNAWRVDDG